MDPLVIILIAVIALILIVAAIMVVRRSRKRRDHLQQRFGPEYDRTVGSADSRRDAERELAERESRRAELEIRPLPHGRREHYLERWDAVQLEFVDAPIEATRRADAIIVEVMRERGYPVEDRDHRAADLSVDHPDIVEQYRDGHRRIDGTDDTEAHREAMLRFRDVFDRVVSDGQEAHREIEGAAPSERDERRVPTDDRRGGDRRADDRPAAARRVEHDEPPRTPTDQLPPPPPPMEAPPMEAPTGREGSAGSGRAAHDDPARPRTGRQR